MLPKFKPDILKYIYRKENVKICVETGSTLTFRRLNGSTFKMQTSVIVHFRKFKYVTQVVKAVDGLLYGNQLIIVLKANGKVSMQTLTKI